MEFSDLKVILSSFGLWVKVSAAYNPDGSVKDFKMLEKLTEKLARSTFGEGRCSGHDRDLPQPKDGNAHGDLQCPGPCKYRKVR